MRSALVLLSGGKDSAIALWWAQSKFDQISALSIGYPERPAQERRAAEHLAERADVTLIDCTLPFIETKRALQQEHSRFITRNAYVPMRNALFYTVAAYYAECLGIEDLVGGQLRSDGIAYGDARSEFLTSLISLYGNTIPRGQEGSGLRLHLPLIDISDAEAMRTGRDLGVPFELTWSCLENGADPCESCVSCLDRIRLL